MNRKRQLLSLVKSATNQSLKDGRLQATQIRKFSQLFAKMPYSQALFCLKNFKTAISRQQDLTTLKIASASPLSTTEVAAIKCDFAKTHHILNTELIKDPSLLGGIRVKIGDDQYEDSISSRIKQLKGAIANQ